MPSMSDQDVLIRILTAYEKGGMEAAIASAKELQKTVDENSEAGKTLSGALDLLNSKGQSAGQVFNGVSGILKGGQGAAAGFANVVKGLGGALGMAAGPLALLTTGVGLAITAWQKYKSAQEEAAEAAKKAAEEEKAAAEQAKKAAEEMSKVLGENIARAAENVRDKIKGIADEFKAASDASKELSNAMSEVEDAQLALELAQIDAEMGQKKGESDADYASRKAELEKRKVELKAGRERNKIQGDADQYQSQLTAMNQGEEAAFQAVLAAGNAITARDWKNWLGAKDELDSRTARTEQIREKVRLGEASEGELKRAEKLQNNAQARFDEISGSKGALGGMVGTRASAYLAAQEAQKALLEQNAPQKQALQAKIDALSIKQQTKDVERTTEIRKIDEEAQKAQKKTPAPVAKQEQTTPSKPTVGSLWRDAKGRFVNAQYYKGTMYEGDAAGDTRQKSLEALAEAGRKMVEGKSGDDATVIRELLDVWKQLGTVMTDKDKVLEDLKEAVSQMRSQIKNSR